LIKNNYNKLQIDSISIYEKDWLNSLGLNHSTIGTVEDNFNGGWSEYQKVFLNKIEYPKQLNVDKSNGGVLFEIEIGTIGKIVNFKIINSNSPSLDKEIESKIYLTDGKWKTEFYENEKTNYFILGIIDFESK
jgi:hypothetical protein